MGCSYDIVSANIKKENKAAFIKMFNKILAEDLYDDEWCVADEDCFEDDGDRSQFGLDQEPLFSMMLNGDQLIPFFKAFLAKYPDNDFNAYYECTFNNCGAMAIKYFTFKDGVMTIESKFAEEGYISECPECGYEDESGDDIFSLDAWDEGKPLICPGCGAEIELDDACKSTEEINVLEDDDYDFDYDDDDEDEEDDFDEDEE